MSCSIKKIFKKKLKPNSLGKYLPMYIQTTTILSQQYRIIRTYRVPIQMLNKKQCFIIQQELKKRGVKQLKFKSPQ